MRRLLLAVILLSIAAAVSFREMEQRWLTPLNISPPGYTVTLAPGERLRGVVDSLHEKGVVTYPYLLLAYGRWTGQDEQIKHGEYLIPAGTTAEGLLQILTAGIVIQYQVTLPEGIHLAQALVLLGQQQQLEKVLSGPMDKRIAMLAKPHASAEGLIFPDSYRYEKGTTDWQILQRANQRMQNVLSEEWQTREPMLPYETPYDALIMASIVERETGTPSERRQIAGVFVQRLLKKMRLQTDPTVIYGLGALFDGNLRRRHLQDGSNLYNTYRHNGLPPTPIALPGRAAINAALHPDKGSALYFVARGDGSHQFSNTLKEHQDAVRKYQLNRRENYRSSPEKH